MGPPLGGVLFEKLGFRAPFILSIAFAAVDLIGRLLVIERVEAVKWLEKEKRPEINMGPMQGADGTVNVSPLQTVAPRPADGGALQLSVIQVIIVLCRNRKATTAFLEMLCYGCVAPNSSLCVMYSL
jgi:MFS family permease